jgi:hypothetical protein
MADEQPFYAPDKRPAPTRQPKPGEHIWTYTRGTDSRRTELRDFGKAGAELQILVNGEFVSGRRYEARGLALADAEALRDTLEASGWTCSRCWGELWTCEVHPHLPAGHDATCHGPGEPCAVCNTSEPPRPPRGFVSLIGRE